MRRGNSVVLPRGIAKLYLRIHMCNEIKNETIVEAAMELCGVAIRIRSFNGS